MSGGEGLLGEHRALEHPIHGQTLGAQFATQFLATGLDEILASFAGEPLLDLVASLRRHHEVEPVARRRGRLHLGGEDLAGVTGPEFVGERNESTVHPGADARVPDLGVHGVGEIDRYRPDRQGDHPSLGGEHEDLVLF